MAFLLKVIVVFFFYGAGRIYTDYILFNPDIKSPKTFFYLTRKIFLLFLIITIVIACIPNDYLENAILSMLTS